MRTTSALALVAAIAAGCSFALQRTAPRPAPAAEAALDCDDRDKHGATDLALYSASTVVVLLVSGVAAMTGEDDPNGLWILGGIQAGSSLLAVSGVYGLYQARRCRNLRLGR